MAESLTESHFDKLSDRERLFVAETPEAEGVGDDADGAEGHTGGGDHRVQKEAVDRIEDSCGDRHGQDVVEEGPEKILPDDLDGTAGKDDHLRKFRQIRRYDCHHSCVNRDIAAFTHSDTKVSLRQSRAVIDPVTHHRHTMPLTLKPLNEYGLVSRQHSSLDAVYADLTRDIPGGHRIVTGKHNNLNPKHF